MIAGGSESCLTECVVAGGATIACFTCFTCFTSTIVRILTPDAMCVVAGFNKLSDMQTKDYVLYLLY